MQSLDSFLDAQLAADKTPAVQYRFFSADTVLRRYDGGWADITGQIPVSPRTTYNGFSVTKTFTALALLQLAEQGSVDLDSVS